MPIAVCVLCLRVVSRVTLQPSLTRFSMTFRAVLFLTGLCLLAPPPAAAQSPVDDTRVLRAGDAVGITVWRDEDLSGEFPVAYDGSVGHPLLRDVYVVGVPLAEVESRIHARLATLRTNPQFFVQPLLSVSVGGEVRMPSLYRLPPSTSISEAVALAGGASERARLDRVRLFRDGEEIRVDLTLPEAGLAQTPIQSGDQLYVDRRTSIFREYIAPAGSITAAIVSLISVLTR